MTKQITVTKLPHFQAVKLELEPELVHTLYTALTAHYWKCVDTVALTQNPEQSKLGRFALAEKARSKEILDKLVPGVINDD